MDIFLCLCFLQEVNTGEFRNLEVFCKCNIGCPTFVDVIKIPQNLDIYKVAKMTRMRKGAHMISVSMNFKLKNI